jgi:hypothetical protein
MNWPSIFIWGLVATIVLTTTLRFSQALGITRMDLPFMLGTMFTPDRDRARVIGFVVHMVNGWLFALLYGLIFHELEMATWWLGALLGLGHALFVLTAWMTILPGLHPRMASDTWGPDPTRLLEPPGFLALHYGRRTPLVTLAAHVVYGAILGAFYRLP